MFVLEYIKEKKNIFSIFGLLLIVIVLISFLFKKENKEEIILNATKEEKEEVCMVDVKGYVNKIGLYKVNCNSRINDLIEEAGGLKEEADTSIINLGRKVFDSMVLIIYSKEEVNNFTEVKKKDNTIENICNQMNNDGCIKKEDRLEVSVRIEEANNDVNNSHNNLISINTATKEDLMTLPGIGEAKAIAIINYRNEHGLFNSIEDIKNVTGIGEKMFEKIKNNIKL